MERGCAGGRSSVGTSWVLLTHGNDAQRLARHVAVRHRVTLHAFTASRPMRRRLPTRDIARRAAPAALLLHHAGVLLGWRPRWHRARTFVHLPPTMAKPVLQAMHAFGLVEQSTQFGSTHGTHFLKKVNGMPTPAYPSLQSRQGVGLGRLDLAQVRHGLGHCRVAGQGRKQLDLRMREGASGQARASSTASCRFA